MNILHIYNYHRGGGGAEIFTRNIMTIESCHGLKVGALVRNSEDLPDGWAGKWRAGVSTIYNVDFARDFRRSMDAFQPDVVHLYDPFPLIPPSILKWCSRRDVPVVMHCVHYRLTCPVATHFHKGQVCQKCVGGREYWAVLRNCRGNPLESVAAALYTSRLRKCSRHVSRFIAPSDFTRQWLIDNAGIEPERVTTVPPAVVIPDDPSDPRAGQYVAFAGRFAPEKGIQTILDASEVCAVPFRFCRNEKFLPGAVPPDVDVFTSRGRDDLHAFYRGARVLVCPSMWFETFGMVAAEAMAHGIPVIASRIGALSDLIEDGKNGLLFEPGDASDLANKIEYLWSDPDLCSRLGRAAREKVSKWNSEHFFHSLNKVYEEVRGALRN